MREYIANALVVALSMAFLGHFYFIATHGTLIIQEPNPIILGLEITGLVVTTIFGIWNMARIIGRHKNV